MRENEAGVASLDAVMHTILGAGKRLHVTLLELQVQMHAGEGMSHARRRIRRQPHLLPIACHFLFSDFTSRNFHDVSAFSANNPSPEADDTLTSRSLS